VTENDLEHLLHLLEGKDVEMEWQSLMERSTPNMAYQAWRHEPEVDFNFDHITCIFCSSFAEMMCEYYLNLVSPRSICVIINSVLHLPLFFFFHLLVMFSCSLYVLHT
jgi:hypothetical protein